MKTSNVSDLMVLKNARLENARVRGRGSESATAREKSLPRILAISNLAVFKRSKFRHGWSFHVKTSRFYF